MANEIHLYTTFIGGYAAADPLLQAESWQFGIRHTLIFGTTDPVGSLPNNWAPSAVAINRTETDWTITGNWTADHGGGTTFAIDDWLNDQVAPAAVAFVEAGSVMNAACVLKEIKAYAIGTTGKAVPAPPYSQGTPILLTFTTIPGGAVTYDALPLQDSIVVSEKTAQIGRKGRGRIYLPTNGTGNIAKGRLSSSAQTAIASAAATFFSAMAVHNTTPVLEEVRPAVIGKPWTQYGTINQVDVGDVVDTQRNRRKSLSEVRVYEPVTY